MLANVVGVLVMEAPYPDPHLRWRRSQAGKSSLDPIT
jgi:hypothetical protein